MTTATISADSPLAQQMFRSFRARRMVSFAVPGVILLYLTYAFFAFDVPGLAARARMDNAIILLSDFWSHKTHVTRDNRSGKITVAIEDISGKVSGLNTSHKAQADGTTKLLTSALRIGETAREQEAALRQLTNAVSSMRR